MRTITNIIPAGVGEYLDIAIAGDYVRVRESAVDLLIENPDSGERIEVSEGDDFEFSEFRRLRVLNTSASAQTVKLTVSKGKRAGASRVSGSVSLSGTSYTQSRASLTNAVQTLIAANSQRVYLLLQNNDASAYMRVTMDGNDPGAAAGFRIGPGDSLEIATNAPTGAIKAIMETASATADNVEFCEG